MDPFIHPRCTHSMRSVLVLPGSWRQNLCYDKNPCLHDDYDLAGEIEDKVTFPLLGSSSVPGKPEAEKGERCCSSEWQIPVRPSEKLSGSMWLMRDSLKKARDDNVGPHSCTVSILWTNSSTQSLSYQNLTQNSNILNILLKVIIWQIRENLPSSTLLYARKKCTNTVTVKESKEHNGI